MSGVKLDVPVRQWKTAVEPGSRPIIGFARQK